MSSIFKEWAPLYREQGFWPRPVQPGAKKCALKSWQKPDPDWPASELQQWLSLYGQCGLGLLMGSPLPGGLTLGALDIDRDEYLPLARTLLGGPLCQRIGKKGAVFFVRVEPGIKNRKFRVKGDAGKVWGQAAECLFHKNFCLVPPTIHPDTSQPYRWEGAPLLGIDVSTLPVIGTESRDESPRFPAPDSESSSSSRG